MNIAKSITSEQVGLWTVEEVADYLTLSSEGVIYRLASNQEIPYVRLGEKLLRFDPTIIENWLLPKRFEYEPVTEWTGRPVLRVGEVALRLAVKKGLVYRMFNEGVLPGRRVGGLWLISAHWLNFWIKARIVYPKTNTQKLNYGEFWDAYYLLMRA